MAGDKMYKISYITDGMTTELAPNESRDDYGVL